jgi:hypothetical protein
VDLVFVGAGAAATDTAGNCSGHSLKGAAEGAAKVVDGEPSLVWSLAASLLAVAVAAGIERAAFAPAGNCFGLSPKGAAEVAAMVETGDDLPVALGAVLTAPSSFLLSRKGAAEGASEVAAGTASAAFGIKPRPLTKGAAKFAAVVATGGEPPVLFTGPEFFWASARGAAEVAAEVKDDGKPSFLSTLAALGAPCVAVRCATAAAGVALALATAGNFSGLSPKGAAEVAAEVKGDGKLSFVSTLAALGAPCVAALAARCAPAVSAAAAGVAVVLALAAVAEGDSLAGSVPASVGTPASAGRLK